MSNDISTQYTKEQNNKTGRRGYIAWKLEKETVISPKEYGQFLENKRRRKNDKGY